VAEESENAGLVAGLIVGMFTLAGYFVGVLGTVYLYMYVLVNLMKYDYVTSSSVMFMMIMAGFVIMAITQFMSLLVSKSKLDKLFVLIAIYLIIYPLFMAASLNLYEVWSKPEISTSINAVDVYRHYIGLPFVFLLKAISSLGAIISHFAPGPFITDVTAKLSPVIGKLSESYSYIEARPLLRGLVLLLAGAVLRNFLPNKNDNSMSQNAMTAMAN